MGDMDILIMGIQEQAEHPHQAAGAIGYLSSNSFLIMLLIDTEIPLG